MQTLKKIGTSQSRKGQINYFLKNMLDSIGHRSDVASF